MNWTEAQKVWQGDSSLKHDRQIFFPCIFALFTRTLRFFKNQTISWAFWAGRIRHSTLINSFIITVHTVLTKKLTSSASLLLRNAALWVTIPVLFSLICIIPICKLLISIKLLNCFQTRLVHFFFQNLVHSLETNPGLFSAGLLVLWCYWYSALEEKGPKRLYQDGLLYSPIQLCNELE